MRIFKSMKDWNGEAWLLFSMCSLLVGGMSCGLRALVGVVCSDGRADYCYVAQQWVVGAPPGSSESYYGVFEHVPWRKDRLIAHADNPERAADLAKQLCSVR